MEGTTKNMIDVPSMRPRWHGVFRPHRQARYAACGYVLHRRERCAQRGMRAPSIPFASSSMMTECTPTRAWPVTTSWSPWVSGSLIDSMNHYGSNDGVEVTLHDVVAQLRVGTVNDSETPGFYRMRRLGKTPRLRPSSKIVLALFRRERHARIRLE